MLTYEEHLVKPLMALFVKKLWRFTHLASAELTEERRSILPNGCFTLAVIRGAGLTVHHKGKSMVLNSGVYYCGQLTQALEVNVRPGTQATMVQLYPWTPVHFTLLDISGYTDCLIPVNELPLESTRIHRLIPQLSSNFERLSRQVESIFWPLLHPTTTSEALTRSIRLILDSQGEIRIARLATELSCSTRYLQKLFKKHLGLSPKELALIIRLRTAVDELAYSRNRVSSLTQLALDNQFYDQAHFINAFQAILKKPPKAFHAPDYLLAFKS